MSDVVLAKVKKNASTEIWVALKVWKEVQYLELREWFYLPDTAQWQPTQKGIMVTHEHIPALTDAVARLADVAELGTVTAMQKSDKEQIQVGLREYQGARFGEVRQYYLDGSDYKPTKKGVTFKPSLAEQLADAIRSAEDALEESE